MKHLQSWTSFVAAVLVALLVGACADRGSREVSDPRETWVATEPAWLREYEPVEEVFGTPEGSLFEPRTWLMRDQESWERWWAIISASYAERLPVPPVNFRDSMLLAATSGAVPASGPLPTFEGYHVAYDTLYVALRFDEPAHGCDIATLEAEPVVVARLPKHDLPVVIRERTVRHPCW